LAEKLNHLFQTVKPEAHREYTYKEVEDGIAQAAHGLRISHTYIWQLRNGTRDNPTLNHLQALADFFGVPTTYFIDDAIAEKIDAQLDLVNALRDLNVQRVALRAAGLSAGGLDALEAVIDHLRRVEGISSATPPPSPPMNESDGR
jgi:transcriptional regulator with XRE-family HTH domain